MATSKTLTPTNVTIQIPEFTDQPDQRVNSNCIDKEADAINALNTKLSYQTVTDLNSVTNDTLFFNYANTASNKPSSSGGCGMVINNGSTHYSVIVFANSSSNTQLFVRTHGSNGWNSWYSVNITSV